MPAQRDYGLFCKLQADVALKLGHRFLLSCALVLGQAQGPIVPWVVALGVIILQLVVGLSCLWGC